MPLATSQNDCIHCPPLTTTLQQGTSSVNDCICIAGYYMYDGACKTCPVGTDCSSVGYTLSTLKITIGYFRHSNTSDDVHRCPDAAENCGNGACDRSSSGCLGGQGHRSCRSGLRGIYCRLCIEPDHYYVAASGAAAAHCSECGSVLAITIGVGLASVIGVVLAWRLAVLARRTAPREVQDFMECFMNEYTPRNKLKILVGFYMIASKVDTVYDVALPADVRNVLDVLSRAFTLGIQGSITPFLECAGLSSYTTRLLSWLVLPPIVAAIIVVSSMLRPALKRQAQLADGRAEGEQMVRTRSVDARTRKTLLDRTLPPFLGSMFLLYPFVTNVAFEGFPCHVFDGGRGWLIADVNVECGTPEHEHVKRLAWVAVVIYPIGLWLLYLALLVCSRHAIVSGKKTPLSRSIAFLYAEYNSATWWWELAEMLRKFLLVGLFVVVEPGSIRQVVLATMVCVVFLMVQMQARPYANASDDFLACAASFCLQMLFFCSVIYKYAALTDGEDLQKMMSREQREGYSISSSALTLVLYMSVLGTLVLAGSLAVRKVRLSREMLSERRQLRFVRSKKLVELEPLSGPRSFHHHATTRLHEMISSGLYARDAGGVIRAARPLPTAGPFHIFLSHNWKHGQEKMRIIKERLYEMMRASVFLGDACSGTLRARVQQRL